MSRDFSNGKVAAFELGVEVAACIGAHQVFVLGRDALGLNGAIELGLLLAAVESDGANEEHTTSECNLSSFVNCLVHPTGSTKSEVPVAESRHDLVAAIQNNAMPVTCASGW